MTPSAVLAAARAVHFASALLLFGELAFALFVAAGGQRHAGIAASGAGENGRRIRAVGLWCIAAGLGSWLVWLACEAQLMSGAPLAQALNAGTLALVIGRTEFGWVWVLRIVLAIAAGALLWREHREREESHARRLAAATLLVAGAYLASLAWAGHSAAGEGAGGYVQLGSDAIHLLAAGAWLGALPPLVAMLGEKPARRLAIGAVQRFSTLGMTSVGALLATGLVNAWYLVGSVPRLLGTDYGRLLLAKVALFAAMLALAAVNRFALTPRLARGALADMVRLRRNASLEVAAGAGVIAIVGALGITVPAAHQAPVWPFSRGLDLGPAYPTSYAPSPIPYATAAIVRGAALYAERCGACHGPGARGDGPDAASLSAKPADLVEHASRHRPGDLFWLTAHGIAGTPMPAFAGILSDDDVWRVVQFVRALSNSDAARTMSGSMDPPRPLRAPDFSFEAAAMQESLSERRGRGTTLLVLYTLPQSLPRLQALEVETREYAGRGARVIALPMHLAAESPSLAPQRGGPIRAIASADVAQVYARFARVSGNSASDPTPDHVEFLIDRQGYLRRRWVGVPDAGVDRTAEVFSQIAAVEREPMRAPAEEHMH